MFSSASDSLHVSRFPPQNHVTGKMTSFRTFWEHLAGRLWNADSKRPDLTSVLSEISDHRVSIGARVSRLRESPTVDSNVSVLRKARAHTAALFHIRDYMGGDIFVSCLRILCAGCDKRSSYSIAVPRDQPARQPRHRVLRV